MPEPTRSELLEARLARHEEAEDDKEDGEDGDSGEQRTAVKGDIVRLGAPHRVERVEGVDGEADEHEERADDDEIQDLERQRNQRVPAAVGVCGAQDALGEDQVDDEEDDDACGDEDLGRDGHGNVGRMRGPGEAHRAGGDARHAEAEHGA